MAGPLFKLVGVLGIDATQFEKGISTAKTTLGGFGGGAQAAFKVVGTAAAIGFGFATKGALEAERAQGAFMAATGKTREEAKKFVSQMDSLAGTSGTVGKTFEEIAATGTMVAQQFQVTGDEATELTSDILKFAKVTGQDATSAAGALEDTLSSFGLGAKDAAGLMDMLKKSSQDFGTDAGPAAVDALRNMAPALTAMGEGLDYGIGALNLFETAGLDAATGQIAFNKAVDDIPPGGSFDDIIAKLGAIEDPLARDAAAVDIFGEKAGHKMALAIKPGMTSLDDFRVSAEEAAGTVDKASDDMLTFGDRIKGFADKALAGAREVGNEFGPALTGLASLGSLAAPFAKGLKGMFSGLIAKVLPSAVAVGTATGAAEAEAHVAGATGAGFLTKIKGAFGSLIGKIIPSAAATGAATGAAEAEAHVAASTGVGLVGKIKGAFAALIGKVVPDAIAVGVATGTAEGEAHVAAATGPGVVKSLFGRIAAMAIPLAPAGTTVGTAVGAAMGAGITVGLLAAGAAGANAGILINEFFGGPGTKEWVANQGRDAAIRYAAGYSDEVRAGAGKVVHDAIHAAMERGMTAQQAALIGEQAGLDYLKGFTKTDMSGLAAHIADERGDFLAVSATIGDDAGETLSGNFVSSFGGGVDGGLAELTLTPFSETRAYAGMIADARALGASVPGQIGKGIQDKENEVLDGVASLRELLTNGLSPKARALQLIGSDYVSLVKQGMDSNIDGAIESARSVAAAAINTIEQGGLEGVNGEKGLRQVGKLFDELIGSGMSGPAALALLEEAGVTADSSVLSGVRSKYPQFFTTGEGAANKTIGGWKNGKWYAAGFDATTNIVSGVKAYSWYQGGWNTAKSWIGGFHDKFDAFNWANLINSTVGPYTRGQSPPKKGPLREVGKWGFNVAGGWVKGFGSGLARGFGRLAPPSFRLPVMPPLAAPGLALAGGGGASGGIHIHFHGPVVTDRATLNKLGEDIENARRQFVRGANRQSGR